VREVVSEILQPAGLKLGDVSYRKVNDLEDLGTVVAQRPKAGEKVESGWTVDLVVGIVGGESPSIDAVAVPSVVGLPREEAVASLIAVRLLPEVNALGGDDGIVTAQRPSAGSMLGIGAKVVIDARCEPAPCPFKPGTEIFDPCSCSARAA